MSCSPEHDPGAIRIPTPTCGSAMKALTRVPGNRTLQRAGLCRAWLTMVWSGMDPPVDGVAKIPTNPDRWLLLRAGLAVVMGAVILAVMGIGRRAGGLPSEGAGP